MHLELVSQRLAAFQVARADVDLRPGLDESLRNGGADALGATGDEHGLAGNAEEFVDHIHVVRSKNKILCMIGD